VHNALSLAAHVALRVFVQQRAPLALALPRDRTVCNSDAFLREIVCKRRESIGILRVRASVNIVHEPALTGGESTRAEGDSCSRIDCGRL